MIQRRTPLKRTPLRKVSKKRAKESRIYFDARAIFLALHPICQVWLAMRGFKELPLDFYQRDGRIYSFLDMFHNGAPRSVDIHHKSKRTGTNYLDESTWLAVSREAHEQIHNNRSWARENGFLK